MQQKRARAPLFPFSLRDSLISGGILLCAVSICILLQMTSTSDGFASPVFVLATLLISRLTNGYLFGLLASLAGTICVNFIFTYPYWSVNFTMAGYPVTFFTLLSVSLITCATTAQLKQQERLRAETEKEKMRSNLLRSVSHDIRTPLTSIVGVTSAILDNPDISPEKQRKLLQDARDEAQWLIRVVENLLSITRIGDSQAQISKEPEAAEEILGDSVRKFRKRFPQINTHVEIPGDLLLVPMDAMLIGQVLSNLMENAVIHGETTTEILLSARAEGNWARFSVIDNGKGIPPEELPKLFDGTLHRSESSSGDGKRNMGLGLSVCLAIVRAHGGTMEARNLIRGAEFSFRLPLTEEVSS